MEECRSGPTGALGERVSHVAHRGSNPLSSANWEEFLMMVFFFAGNCFFFGLVNSAVRMIGRTVESVKF